MIYDEADVFRNQKSRDVLYMNAKDIKKLGLSNGSIVDVKSETGSLKKVKLAKFDIKPGNVMTYMPEANILIPQNNDERSKTPSFKSVSVTIINH
ncbi:MAG: molybdopterin dinucleotide binding domain-containing protein [Gammaproteobacteria bacterium]|jgi:anaerobic selenocysteine-containing dehydrogenase|tara:strand:- start:266 stop:550 length:285 start_codon:yes stop_codon:yes gene_type:complete